VATPFKEIVRIKAARKWRRREAIVSSISVSCNERPDTLVGNDPNREDEKKAWQGIGKSMTDSWLDISSRRSS